MGKGRRFRLPLGLRVRCGGGWSRILRAERLAYDIPYSLVWRVDSVLHKFAAGREPEMHPIAALFAGRFKKYDVLLCPVNPFTAQPHNFQASCHQWRYGSELSHLARYNARST